MIVPSGRDLAIVAYRDQGHTAQEAGQQFGLCRSRIKVIERRTRDYVEAVALLPRYPDKFILLERTGKLRPSAVRALRSRGFQHLEDCKGMTFSQLVHIPYVGRRSAEAIMRIAAECGVEIKPHIDDKSLQQERLNALVRVLESYLVLSRPPCRELLCPGTKAIDRSRKKGKRRRRMRSIPSDQDLAVVTYRGQGHTRQEAATHFRLTVARVRATESRAQNYVEAAKLLPSDPYSFVLLAKIGKLALSTALALRRYGIERPDDLRDMSSSQLLRIPHVGRLGAAAVARIAAECGVDIN